jgi:hypothetical protein
MKKTFAVLVIVFCVYGCASKKASCDAYGSNPISTGVLKNKSK